MLVVFTKVLSSPLFRWGGSRRRFVFRGLWFSSLWSTQAHIQSFILSLFSTRRPRAQPFKHLARFLKSWMQMGVALHGLSHVTASLRSAPLLLSALLWGYSEVCAQHLRTAGHSVTGRCFRRKQSWQATSFTPTSTPHVHIAYFRWIIYSSSGYRALSRVNKHLCARDSSRYWRHSSGKVGHNFCLCGAYILVWGANGTHEN